MRDDATRYTFKINGLTPETMPFGRLVEYYREIKRMVGISDHLHLIDIVESSHATEFTVDAGHVHSLVDRLAEINQGRAPRLPRRAYDTINGMLKEDGVSGTFRDRVGDNILNFVGRRAEGQTLIRIRDTATFTGELYHISGQRDDVRVRISTDTYGVVFCTTTKSMARALRDFLFEKVCISGRGTWIRTESDKWDIDDFTITDFSPISDESLRDAVARVRALNISWPDDPVGEVRRLEEKAE